MVRNPRHQSRLTAARPRIKRTPNPAIADTTNDVARMMLEEGRELVSRREQGAQFTLDVPKEHAHHSRKSLMFSLLILADMYGLRAESYVGDTFTFTKINASGDQNQSEGSVFPLTLNG